MNPFSRRSVKRAAWRKVTQSDPPPQDNPPQPRAAWLIVGLAVVLIIVFYLVKP